MPSARDHDPIYQRRLAIGEQLRQARIAREMTQEQVAHATGLDRPSVVRIEAGQVDARLSTLLRLGAALDLRLTYEADD